MKNIYTALMLLCVIITSCKKDNKKSTGPNGKLYNVTFNLSNFIQQHTGFAGLSTNNIKKTDALPSYVETFSDTATKHKVLYFSVGAGTGVTPKVEYEGDANFGIFSTQLIAGTYTFYFACGENDYPKGAQPYGIQFLDPYGNGLSYVLNLGGQDFYDGVNDLFVKVLTITVGNTDINQAVSLDRVVGKLDVVIQDAIPANVNSFTIQMDSIATGYNLTGTVGPGVVKRTYTQEFDIPNSLQGTTNYDMSTLIMNTTKPFTVTITANTGTGSNIGMVATKVISGVTCQPNKVTILQGNLFGGNGTSTGGSINVKVDTTWSVAAPTVFHF